VEDEDVTPPAAHDLVLTMSGVSKRYGRVQALDSVDFELAAGEVMALLGENGAGKSTLVKILSGLVAPDEGEAVLEGEPISFTGSVTVNSDEIAIVQQELSVVPSMTVAENVFLGGTRFPRTWLPRRLAATAKPYLEQVGLGDLNPRRFVESLSVGQRQLVEIARLLARDARILILDEPTAALSDVEIERVLEVVKRLAAQGRSVVYVSHRLNEVFEIADRATIFRNGKSQPPVAVKDLDVDGLVERMLGRRLGDMYPDRPASFGVDNLDVSELAVPGIREPISLQVRAGEIVGLAGQLGSGAPTFLRAIAGIGPNVGGTITVQGRSFPRHSRGRAAELGICYCSDDRKRDGIFASRTVLENLTSPSLGRVSRFGWLSRRKERALAGEISDAFAIDKSRLGSKSGTLSGGNQQKVALGKWIGVQPRVMLVEEPTRGVDVGARAEIYRHLRSLADGGMSIVIASSELPEVLGLSDTVATFCRGQIVSVRPAEEFTEALLMREVTHGSAAQPAASVDEGGPVE
jgi:ribose transport system ATP-binding protein